MTFLRRMVAAASALALCLTLAACGSEKSPREPAPTREDKPILPGFTETTPSPNDYTAAYVTVFEDLAIIATYPVLEWGELEMECDPRELSDGGSILCGGDHETEHPITRVLIADQLVPKSMAGWFRDMVHLREITGLEKVLTHHVTDMNHLFAGCRGLAEVNIDAWDVSGVVDFTGIFQGCDALDRKPSWYEQGNSDTFG